jgi:hypothetical protein
MAASGHSVLSHLSPNYYTYCALSMSREYLSRQPTDKVLGVAKRKNPHAVALGRIGGKKGGSKGGKTSAAKMTPEERRERARKAALARWKKARDE